MSLVWPSSPSSSHYFNTIGFILIQWCPKHSKLSLVNLMFIDFDCFVHDSICSAVICSDRYTHQSSSATRPEARIFYDSVRRLSVEYSLPQSFLTPKQLKDIEKSSIPKIYVKKCLCLDTISSRGCSIHYQRKQILIWNMSRVSLS